MITNMQRGSTFTVWEVIVNSSRNQHVGVMSCADGKHHFCPPGESVTPGQTVM